MAAQTWELNLAQAEITRLIAPGVLGFYTHFEGTEVFAKRDGQGPVINVFSIMAAEDRQNEAPQAAVFLSDDRIKLKSLRGWSFGICRYTQPIAALVPALEVLGTGGEWRQSGEALTVGKVTPLSPQFVPPDAIDPVPWNSVLKNNFWNGSHIFEWSDQRKAPIQPLFDDPKRLQELSEVIQEWVPLRLASLSDRLGNLVVQLPVTVVMSKFRRQKLGSGLFVELAWHPKATPRDLQAICEKQSDGVICGYVSTAIDGSQTPVPMHTRRGLFNGVIWDEEHRVILAATGPSAFIETMSMGMSIQGPEPREFVTKQRDGSARRHRVALQSQPSMSVIGEPESDSNGGWTRKRMYADEMSRLEKERRFVQYKPKPGEKHAEREKALGDLRHLINQYGQKGAWLWDPYLSAHDILETLFYCKHSGADLRALRGPREQPNHAVEFTVGGSSVRPDFVEMQRAELDSCQSNWRGLCLEYRIKRGQAGWGFHDRFLIFPMTDRGALAWSLGTSVNSLGKEHHILQRVDNGQLVMDAFVELWDQLNTPEYLIWKKP